ncbi:MAG: HlyD family efflux transporter periplasmic adaptor subunit [Gammaproteobacteria bacterium]|nr:HlyD family efflux transporter periplasmic adaptor subunit [Gammaproteobacteria bacterium]
MRLCLASLLFFFAAAAGAVELTGKTEFRQQLDLTSSISARVVAIEVSPGQRVNAGDILLRLDATLLDADVALAEARIAALEPVRQEMATELEKAQELFDRDSLAMVELQRAEQDYAIAEARLAAARAEMTKAQHRKSQAELRAPADATVLAIDAFVGQYVNTLNGDPVLIRLGADRPMLARALLPLELSGKIVIGQQAQVRYGERTFTGRVVEVGRRVIVGGNNHPALELGVAFDVDEEMPANLTVNIDLLAD